MNQGQIALPWNEAHFNEIQIDSSFDSWSIFCVDKSKHQHSNSFIISESDHSAETIEKYMQVTQVYKSSTVWFSWSSEEYKQSAYHRVKRTRWENICAASVLIQAFLVKENIR